MLELKNDNFLTPSCQNEVDNHIVYTKGIIIGTPLGTGDLPILTLQYQFPCDSDSKLLQQKNCNPQVQVYSYTKCTIVNMQIMKYHIQ